MKEKNTILSNTKFYGYILSKIEADMIEKNLTTYKLRSKTDSDYIISSSTYDNIKAISEGNNKPLLNNKNLKKLCDYLKIKFNHKYEIIK